jgi:hypothetical protein
MKKIRRRLPYMSIIVTGRSKKWHLTADEKGVAWFDNAIFHMGFATRIE